jgi:hypothetical protein
MHELAITQKDLEDLWASRDGDGQRVWSFLDLKLMSYFPFWTRQGGKYPSWRRLSAAIWGRKATL